MRNQSIQFALTGPISPEKKERLLTLFRMLEAAYDGRRIRITYDARQADVRFTLPCDESDRLRRAYAMGAQVLELNLESPARGANPEPADPYVIW